MPESSGDADRRTAAEALAVARAVEKGLHVHLDHSARAAGSFAEELRALREANSREHAEVRQANAANHAAAMAAIASLHQTVNEAIKQEAAHREASVSRLHSRINKALLALIAFLAAILVGLIGFIASRFVPWSS
jgi:siderophore synthetase component